MPSFVVNNSWHYHRKRPNLRKEEHGESTFHYCRGGVVMEAYLPQAFIRRELNASIYFYLRTRVLYRCRGPSPQ